MVAEVVRQSVVRDEVAGSVPTQGNFINIFLFDEISKLKFYQ